MMYCRKCGREQQSSACIYCFGVGPNLQSNAPIMPLEAEPFYLDNRRLSEQIESLQQQLAASQEAYNDLQSEYPKEIAKLQYVVGEMRKALKAVSYECRSPHQWATMVDEVVELSPDNLPRFVPEEKLTASESALTYIREQYEVKERQCFELASILADNKECAEEIVKILQDNELITKDEDDLLKSICELANRTIAIVREYSYTKAEKEGV